MGAMEGVESSSSEVEVMAKAVRRVKATRKRTRKRPVPFSPLALPYALCDALSLTTSSTSQSNTRRRDRSLSIDFR